MSVEERSMKNMLRQRIEEQRKELMKAAADELYLARKQDPAHTWVPAMAPLTRLEKDTVRNVVAARLRNGR